LRGGASVKKVRVTNSPTKRATPEDEKKQETGQHLTMGNKIGQATEGGGGGGGGGQKQTGIRGTLKKGKSVSAGGMQYRGEKC